ncbi:mannose-1-phosphate guanylyltransferase [Martelella soudanensis]|uniref:mannose-1-phosphate guanylyltransferase n=1 Tax=unclassified Martelella TaxID=2629616 RepID=UPI0015DE21ED|nr:MULTISPECIES: sugar phosphate nucleotidyltransferase [unclassified Martelella]
MRSIYPLIMCGGVGMRLWPLSRVETPKQFHRVAGRGSPSFFQATVERHSGPGFHDPYVSVNSRYEALVRAQLHAVGRAGELMIEESSRHTGPAVLAVALAIEARDPGALMAVLPSDHLIEGDFGAVVLSMRAAAENGRIVLFGIHPAYAETGYGYIVDDGPNTRFAGARDVSHFIEKPPREVAEKLIAEGNAYWASGVSLFRADVLISEYQRLDPETTEAVRAAVEGAAKASGRTVLDDRHFRKAHGAATESVVFEHSDRVLMAPADIAWNDVGSWRSLYEIGTKDGAGNVASGDVVSVDTAGSYIRAQDGKLIATVGIDNLAIIDTEDALLVASLDRTQDVPLVLSALKERKGRSEITKPKWAHSGTPLKAGAGYRLAEHEIIPGAALSIAAEESRNRVLTICAGNLELEQGAGWRGKQAGDTVAIPAGLGCVLRNHGEVTATLIELQYDAAELDDAPILASGGEVK